MTANKGDVHTYRPSLRQLAPQDILCCIRRRCSARSSAPLHSVPPDSIVRPTAEAFFLSLPYFSLDLRTPSLRYATDWCWEFSMSLCAHSHIDFGPMLSTAQSLASSGGSRQWSKAPRVDRSLGPGRQTPLPQTTGLSPPLAIRHAFLYTIQLGYPAVTRVCKPRLGAFQCSTWTQEIRASCCSARAWWCWWRPDLRSSMEGWLAARMCWPSW